MSDSTVDTAQAVAAPDASRTADADPQVVEVVETDEPAESDSDADDQVYETEDIDTPTIIPRAGELTPFDRVTIARHPGRPGAQQFIDALFTDFFEQHGDRLGTDDPSIVGGIALFHGRPVTVLGNRKGSDLDERIRCRFGMATPEGYRKAQRIMREAQKFGRPVITFVDTPGAFPGLEAEANGQGDAIARTIALMSSLTVPTIAVITGEGGSGGALALGVGNRVLMLENAVYSVLSPEGFASILWKDSSKNVEACDVMKLTAQDLLELGVIDGVIPEPAGGAHEHPEALYQVLDTALARELEALSKMSPSALEQSRYKKFRAMGANMVKKGRV